MLNAINTTPIMAFFLTLTTLIFDGNLLQNSFPTLLTPLPILPSLGSIPLFFLNLSDLDWFSLVIGGDAHFEAHYFPFWWKRNAFRKARELSQWL